MGEEQHTPLPWMQDHFLIRTVGQFPNSTHVAHTGGVGGTREKMLANAEFIVRACNSHEQLLEACKAALKAIIEDWAEWNEDGAACVITKIRAAIAAGEGREG